MHFSFPEENYSATPAINNPGMHSPMVRTIQGDQGHEPVSIPTQEKNTSLRQDIGELCKILRELLDSCSDHEVTMDALVTPASPGRYHDAWERISLCVSRILASGATREYLAALVLDLSCPCRSILEGVVDPLDLVPLMGGVLPNEERALVRKICRGWARAISPCLPAPLEEELFSAARPVTLADLLSPEITRMQRFSTILLLKVGGMDLPLHFPTTAARDGWIPIPPPCTPAKYGAETARAVYCYLAQNRFLPHAFFPETVLQALEDWGAISTVGLGAFRTLSARQSPCTLALFDAGQGLGRKDKVRDIRTLYRVAEEALKPFDGKEGELRMHPDFTRLGGHVLAGYLYACCSAGAKGLGESGEEREDTPGFLGLFVEFLQETASRPSGRAVPGPEQLRDLDGALQEIRQLLNAITGDYCWRYRPFFGSDRPLFPVEVHPGQHLLLYDPEELAYRDRDTALALAVEAYYRSGFGLRPPLDGIPEAFRSWFARLAAVTGNLRASRKGFAIHTGAAAWLERLSSRESDRPNLLADQVRNAQLTLPDRFLAAAYSVSRYGNAAETGVDSSIRHVFEVTMQARDILRDPQVPDEVCCAILCTEIWPACAPLFGKESAGTGVAGQSTSSPSPLHPGVVPLSATPGYGAQVPGPHTPCMTTAGKTITGQGSGLLDDEEYTVLVSAPGPGARAPAGNHGPNPATRTGQSSSGSVQEIADQLLRTCRESGDLIDTLASGTPTSREKEPDILSRLGESARRLDELAARLESQVRQRAPAGSMSEPSSRQQGAPGRAGSEDWGTLRGLSRDVRKAARQYYHAIEKLDSVTGYHERDLRGHETRTGLPRDALLALQKAGIEFLRLAGALPEPAAGEWQARVRLGAEEEDPGQDTVEFHGTGRMEPSFDSEALASPEIWESFSYFDAIYGDDHATEENDTSRNFPHKGNTEQRDEMGEHALTREAERYLATLKQRTRSEWETLDESAERIRQAALYEYLAVGQDDYALYQRFYQPVAGLIGVAKKNIQQAFQKNRATDDLTELAAGDDIDEENLSAIRTTMRIFKETGQKEDETLWTISLLVDASSSMHDETVSKKLDATLQAAILFGEAVSHIAGIRFEIAAFADSEYIPLKRYQDDWNVHQGCFLIRQVIQAAGGTNDVGAVSGALDRMARLRNAAGSNRMIFIISDGQSGVGGREQMREVLARDPATRIFGWGIGPDMQMVEETYRPYGTWVPDIASLPRCLGEVLRRELGRPAMAGWKDECRGPRIAEDPCMP